MWVKQTKVFDKKKVSTLTFRKKGIGLNRAFSSEYGITVGSFCELFFSDDGLKLGMRFSIDQKDDCFVVGTDGGGNRGKTHSSLFIACGATLERSDIYSKLCLNNESFDILHDSDVDMYYVNIIGKFVHNTKDRELLNDEFGVYRYLSEGEIVYIGQGNIKNRMNVEHRDNWIYDVIEYMIVEKKSDREKIESENIDSFFSTTGRLPIYNRVKGLKSKM